MSFYHRYLGSELQKQVGNDDGGFRNSTGESGHLAFGPHISLGPGNYIAAFYIRRIGPASGAAIAIDVIGEDVGQLAHARRVDSELFSTIAGQVAMQFTLNRSVSQIEARIYVEANALISVHELVIFSVESKRWAA